MTLFYVPGGIFLVNKTDKEPALVELTFDRELCDLPLKNSYSFGVEFLR